MIKQNITQFPQILTIAGIDSSGGAGINADIVTAFAHQVYAASVVIAITAQNTYGVQATDLLPPTIIEQQFASINDDLAIRAVKTGMLGDKLHVEMVATALEKYDFGPIIIDPVMIAKGGARLLTADAIMTIKTRLLPLATLVTPNLLEAEALVNFKINNEQTLIAAAKEIQQLGAQNVLIKGGHGQGHHVKDLLLLANGQYHILANNKLATQRTHGTGDTYAAAIVSNLATGMRLVDAVFAAKEYLMNTIKKPIIVGHGHGPLNHWAQAEGE